jgi:type I restriction enzyme, R subunit
MNTEADTYRKYVVPTLLASGRDTEPHSIADQRTVTYGRGIPVGNEDRC